MFKNQPPHRASETLLTALGETMEEQPVIGTDLTDPVTGQPVMQGSIQVVANKDHNDALSENPNPLLTSGFTFVGQFVDHDITFDTTTLERAAVRPLRHHQLPHAPLRPRRHLWAGPNENPQFYDPKDRDKFLIVSDPTPDQGLGHEA